MTSPLADDRPLCPRPFSDDPLTASYTRTPMKSLDWYFDFISPYAYLQNAVLSRVAPHAAIRRRPILFGGLLAHWGHLGPAEIPPKRDWTYLHCAWLAERHGIVLRQPSMHPFNPLPLLRLSIALGNTEQAVTRLFAFVWRDGHVPGDAAAWKALLAECAVDEVALQDDAIKQALRDAGRDAVAAGVFGVPSAVVDGRAFWGFEATDMLIARLEDDPFFTGPAARAALAVPLGTMRPQATRGTA